MGICQIIFTVWMAMGVGINLAKHGQPQTGRYNFVIALVSAALEVLLLYFGGFYG